MSLPAAGVDTTTFVPAEKCPNTPAWFRYCAQRIAEMPKLRSQYRSSLLIVSTQRSGSKLLCDLLTGTGLAGLPGEYLNPRCVAAFAECRPQPAFLTGAPDIYSYPPDITRLQGSGRRLIRFEDRLSPYKPYLDLEGYLSFLRERAITPNGVFACNAHLDHLMFLERAGVDFTELGFHKVIFLERRDVVAQAVSLAMASKYDHWISHVTDPKPADATVSRAEMLRGLAALEDWRGYFERKVRPVVDMTITYEVIRDKPAKVAELLVNLGLCDRAPDIPSARLRPTRAPGQWGQVTGFKLWLTEISGHDG